MPAITAQQNIQEQFSDRIQQLCRPEFSSRTNSCRHGEQHAQKSPHPPGRDCSPRKSEQRRRFAVNQMWMEYREVLETNPRGDLIVQDPLANRGDDAEQNDLQ